MAVQQFDRIILRHRTKLEWETFNETLLLAEKGVETDTGREKTGDGVTPWNELGYSGGVTEADVTPTLSDEGFDI